MTDRPRTTGLGPPHSPGFLTDGVPMQALLVAWRRRWKLIAGVVLLTLLGTIIVVLRNEPKYRATAVLRVADTRYAVSAAIDLPPANPAADRRFDPVFSQLHLLQSRTVLAQVVEAEGLRLLPVSSEVPVAQLRDVRVEPAANVDTLRVSFSHAGFALSTGTAAAAAVYGARADLDGVSFSVDTRPAVTHATLVVLPQDAAIDRVRSGLRAKSRPQTEIIDVSYTAATPLEAQRVVNA